MKQSPIITLFLTALTFCCTIDDQRVFIGKHLNTPFPIIPNPYLNPSQQYLDTVNTSIHNKHQVCALRYLDNSKTTYQLMTFQNETAVPSNYYITHQGRCAACSTLQDLWIYLTTDLTRPVRKCGIKNFYSTSALRSCISRLGFTEACTQIWLWNTINTKKYCNKPCLYALATSQPFVINGELNNCLECDEQISGPIFKYQSGRTRRDSGIHSEIDRPDDQIYNITHCYY